MPRRTIRYIALADDKAKALLTIVEGRKGDLTIVPKSGLNLTVDGVDKEILHEKISLHVSPLSPGTTIKAIYELMGGDTVTKSNFVRGPKSALLMHVYSLACSDMTLDMYDPKATANDEVVVAAPDFNPSATLAYHVIAGAKGTQFPTFEWCRVFVLETNNFSVAVYVNYINLPASPQASVMNSMSSQERVNGKPKGRSIISAGSYNLLPSQLEWVISNLNDSLFYNQVYELTKRIGVSMDVMANVSGIYTLKPIGPNQIHIELPQPTTSIIPPISFMLQGQ